MRVGGWAKSWATALAVATTFIVAAPASATLTLQPAFTGGTVNLPMMVTSPLGDSHRLFILTRTGQIYVAVDGVLQSQPFLDISSQVWTARGEAAMGSMAFDPGYLDPQSPGYGRFYVDYVGPPAQGDKSGPVHIDEFTVAAPATTDVADPGTQRQVLTIPHSSSFNHYGGTIQFGPNDGDLYIGTGDAEDGPNLLDSNAQNTKKSLLGKLLRIDPHQAANGAPYSIPADNPFAGDPVCNPPSGTTDCPEVYAWGFRNPFRWSFDRATGDIAIADVGQDQWEEVDYVPASGTLAGNDFGWPCYEGPQQAFYFPPFCSIPDNQRVDPAFSYQHPAPGLPPPMAITGGVVVRDPALGSLVGRYLYADYFAGRIHSLHLDLPTATDDRVETDLPAVQHLVAFNEDADGHVYVVQLQDNANPNDLSEGRVQRLVCTDCAPPGSSEVNVVEKLDPNTDQGRFDVAIDKQAFDNNGAGYGDRGSTAFTDVGTGQITVSEAGHGTTSLSDYVSEIHCGPKGISNSTSMSFTIAPGEQITCTITNHRKPQVRVINKLDPNTDPGKFDLSIADTPYENGGSGFGDGGDTGFKPVAPGSVTVTEAGHGTTSVGDYDSEVSCDSGRGTSSTNSQTFSVAYGDQVTCTITNHRKPQVRVTPGGPSPDATSPSSTATARDFTPPHVRLGVRRVQNVLQRGIVRLSVDCDEDCVVRVTGRARGLALPGAVRHLRAGERVILELRASARIRRALTSRGVVTISVRGRDNAGNVCTASRTVRVQRGRR